MYPIGGIQSGINSLSLGAKCNNLWGTDNIYSIDNVVIYQGNLELNSRFAYNFEDLKMNANLLQGLHSKKYFIPIKIQPCALSYLFDEKTSNVVIHGQSGSGKTVAALIAVLDEAINWTKYSLGNQVLYITPTATSAETTFNLISELIKFCPKIKTHLAVRGEKAKDRLMDNIVIGTPEKILEKTQYSLKMSNVKMLVIDDAHAVISSRGHQNRIIGICKNLPKDCRRLVLCSIPHNTDMTSFQEKIMNFPVVMEFPFVQSQDIANVTVIYTVCKDLSEKIYVLDVILNHGPVGQTVVFCEKRDAVEELFKELKKQQEMTASIQSLHGKMGKAKIQEVLSNFKEKMVEVLITTPFANISTENVTKIINFDLLVRSDNNGLDHEMYNSRTNRLNKDKKGVIVNIVDERWRRFVFTEDEAAGSLRSVPPAQIKAVLQR